MQFQKAILLMETLTLFLSVTKKVPRQNKPFYSWIHLHYFSVCLKEVPRQNINLNLFLHLILQRKNI